MKLKLFKTKNGYSRTQEDLEEISAQSIITEDEQEDLEEPVGTPGTPEGPEGTPGSDSEADSDVDSSETLDEMDKEGIKTGILNTLRSLIKDEYDAIDGYHNAIQMLYDMDMFDELLPILEDVMHEEYAHIGELQRCLAIVDPETMSSIDSGEEEADELIDNHEVTETNESAQKYYVTTYGYHWTSGPEEGGWTSEGTEVLRSKPMPSFEAAQNYVQEFEDEGLELVETAEDNLWRVEHDDVLKLIAIETDANRGEHHSPALTWAQAESDYEPPKPSFNAEGRPVDEKGRLIESVELVSCPACHGDRFNEAIGLCIDCGYDEKSDDND